MINHTASPVQVSGIRKTLVATLIIMVIFISLIAYKIAQPRFLTTEKMALNGLIVNDEKIALAPFSLTTLDNKAFSEKNTKGRWSLWLFTYTGCQAVCANRLAGVANWHKQLASRFAGSTDLYAVTVNPSNDSPEALENFLAIFDPTMKGVSGEFLSIKRLASQFNIQFNKKPGPSASFLIDAKVAIVNPEGEYVGYFVPSFDLSKMNVTYASLFSYHAGDK